MKTPTARQRQLLDTIRAHIDRHGAPPTRAELARQLGLRAASTVDQHLQALAAKGYLQLQPGLNRNVRLRDLGGAHGDTAAAGLPLIGRVAAGAPILSEAHIESRYRVDPALFTPAPDYLLRVRGMSMRDAGILDGDLLAVHRGGDRPAIRNGQIVVARIDDEVTVKRFEQRIRDGRPQVRLLPENPDFSPLIIDPARDELSIEGIAVGVIRTGRF